MEMDIIKANLKAAFEKPGCPVCRLCQDAEVAYIQTLLLDYVNDGLTRLGFVRSQGLCAYHAWLLQAAEQLDWGDGLKTAIIYESVASLVHKSLSAYLSKHPPLTMPPALPLREKPEGWRGRLARWGDTLAKWLSIRRPPPASPDGLLAKLAPRGECPVCEATQGKEALIVAKLAEGILDPQFWAAFRASEGLCLVHLRQALACSPREEASRLLAKVAHEKLSVLLTHLRGYMNKHRWEDRTLLRPEEKAAWVRIVAFFVGEPREGRSTDALSAMRQEAMQDYFRSTQQNGLCAKPKESPYPVRRHEA